MPTILTKLFAALGFLTLLVLLAGAAMFLSSGDNEVVIEQSLPSPDQRHTATIYRNSGGGAAGWCSIHVAITYGLAPFSPTADNGLPMDGVYSGNCGITPQLEWSAPTVLQITLPAFINDDWSSASVKGTGASGDVAVRFVFLHTE
ncbi:hypothetical protein [Allohahella sp. A8]|uniref:hypothetical protein n=1 Tax=Allohahella sp. A8 TaxID=3141461 RepID=UPI003A80987A